MATQTAYSTYASNVHANTCLTVQYVPFYTDPVRLEGIDGASRARLADNGVPPIERSPEGAMRRRQITAAAMRVRSRTKQILLEAPSRPAAVRARLRHRRVPFYIGVLPGSKYGGATLLYKNTAFIIWTVSSGLAVEIDARQAFFTFGSRLVVNMEVQHYCTKVQLSSRSRFHVTCLIPAHECSETINR